MARGAGWVQARDVLQAVVRADGVEDVRDAVGRVRFLGAGLSHAVYGAACTLADGREHAMVVKLPARDAGPEREADARREAAVLRHLGTLDLPFRVPRPVAEISLDDGLALVQEWVEGVPADLRTDRFPGGRPWELVGRIAAAVHAIDPEPLRSILDAHATRRDHAVAFARTLDDVDGPVGQAAAAWVADHLPPPEPPRLLHGDLLGQNLHMTREDDVVGVVDWGAATLGDPAYDLAIVTRGVRRPFGAPDGLQRLVDAYNRHAAWPLTTGEVHLHEVVLKAGFYVGAVEQYGHGSPHAEEQRRLLRNVLRRAKEARS